MRHALILATEDQLPYRVLRCAAPVFKRVYVLGTKNASALAHSRMCFRYVRHSREQFVVEDIDVINSLCQRFAIDQVLPSDAATTAFLSTVYQELAVESYPVPTSLAFGILNDKHTFNLLCLELGVPVPGTVLYPKAADLKVAVETGVRQYPFIVKPTRESGGTGVARVTSPDSLREISYEPLVAQELIEGQELSAFYLCSRGEIVTEVCYSHERGAIQFVERDDVRRYAKRIIEHLNFQGVLGFDVIKRLDGTLVFLECNPRFWYNMNYVMLAGLNFVALGVSCKPAKKSSAVTVSCLPKINSFSTLGTSMKYGVAYLKVIRYHLVDPERILELRHT